MALRDQSLGMQGAADVDDNMGQRGAASESAGAACAEVAEESFLGGPGKERCSIVRDELLLGWKGQQAKVRRGLRSQLGAGKDMSEHEKKKPKKTAKKQKKKNKKAAKSSSSDSAGKKKDKKKNKKSGKKSSSSGSSSENVAKPAAAASGMGRLETLFGKARAKQVLPKELWENVLEHDEGQFLEVKDRKYGNCCLALAAGRAVVGKDGAKEAVQKWAGEFLTNLKEDMQGRLEKNEAKAGQMLWDDYLLEVTRAAPTKVFCLVVLAEGCTKVWAGDAVKLDNPEVHFLKLEGIHYTALIPKKDDHDIADILPHLPPIDMFSMVGPADVGLSLAKLQKKK